MQLPSGIEISPNLGLISVNEEGDIYEGYDGCMEYEHKFTVDDRIFIAETMIKIWAGWLGAWMYDKAEGPKEPPHPYVPPVFPKPENADDDIPF